MWLCVGIGWVYVCVHGVGVYVHSYLTQDVLFLCVSVCSKLFSAMMHALLL